MKKLYRFFWDCGRMGNLHGLFVSEESEVKKIQGKEVYFGEVLGKHSCIYGTIGADDIKEIDADEDFIRKFEKLIGSIGHNPLDYYHPEDEEDK